MIEYSVGFNTYMVSDLVNEFVNTFLPMRNHGSI